MILLDLSAAFDTINHDVLLDRLAGLGVGGTALWWFHSFLADHVQKVVLGTVALPRGIMSWGSSGLNTVPHAV